MEGPTLALIVVVALIVIVLVKRAEAFTVRNTTPIKSRVDGMTYRVHVSLPDPESAADTLATINRRIIALMRHLKRRYVADGAGRAYPERVAAVQKLLRRYNPDNLAENSPLDPSGDTSYTIDKGALVAFCLRGKRGAPTIHEIDLLTFVAFHELAHIAINATDHPPQFWRTFKFLLAEARDGGILEGTNYKESPERYCGLNVNYNPLFDPATPIIT